MNEWLREHFDQRFNHIEKEIKHMTAQLQALKDEVARTLTTVDAAVAAITAAKDDPAAIAQLTADLKAATDKLAAATAPTP